MTTLGSLGWIREEEYVLARYAARAVANKFRDFVEFDDVQQECLLWIASHREKVEKWRDDPRGVPALRLTLTREARRYAESEKAAKSGYHPSDNVEYSIGLLRKLLPMALDPDWATGRAMELPEDQRRRELPMDDIEVEITVNGVRHEIAGRWSSAKESRTFAEGTGPHQELINSLIDVRRALELVDENSRDILYYAVGADWDYGYLAVEFGGEEPLNVNTVKTKVQRALGKLADVLNEPQGAS